MYECSTPSSLDVRCTYIRVSPDSRRVKGITARPGIRPCKPPPPYPLLLLSTFALVVLILVLIASRERACADMQTVRLRPDGLRRCRKALEGVLLFAGATPVSPLSSGGSRGTRLFSRESLPVL